MSFKPNVTEYSFFIKAPSTNDSCLVKEMQYSPKMFGERQVIRTWKHPSHFVIFAIGNLIVISEDAAH